MILILVLASSLALQSSGPANHQVADASLAARIEALFHAFLTADDDTAPIAEARRIYDERGLPSIAQVGDEASYKFVVLLVSEKLPLDLRTQIASKANEAAARHEIPSDAATFYTVRLRLEKLQDAAKAHPPLDPALRDEVGRMFKVDQAVRQQQGFDAKKMAEVDRQNAAPLQAILDKYGVPTYSMVGPEAAAEFITMIQHQPAQFRQEVLPTLKANVDAGQADPQSYAGAYDRSQRDLGKPQLYGQQLECKARETMHEAPIEDEPHVNQRRAELGLIRVELYARITAEMMPQFCPPSQP
ncbi:MAG TPA: DUF6624 domain-containing protein [Candidatus Acidoferrum sp.]|nr:DUF6624 domain-containing protein [Candidatus Acidoferrum sp.]